MIYEDEIIKEIQQDGYFKEMYENGMTPEEVKDTIMKELDGFFHNKNVLKRIAMDTLVSDWINLKNRRSQISNLDIKIHDVLSLYHKALDLDKIQTLTLIRLFQKEHAKAGNISWTLLSEQEQLNELKINVNDRIYKKMNFLGGSIEGVLKGFLYELYYIIKINKGKTINYSELFKLDYGVIADFLANWEPTTYKILDLKISDWRNIAYHHNYIAVSANKITCTYGKSPNIKEISIREDQLDNVIEQLGEITTILNFAHKFFLFDNAHEISLITSNNNIHERDEIYNLPFICGISSQGFEFDEFNYDALNTHIKLNELYFKEDITIRREHVSQFLIYAWRTTNSKLITIEYFRNNNINMRVSTTANNCKRISKGEFELSTFFKKIQTEFFD